ncbi:hypothetical protein H0W26_01775, partial [Candidatus Dependentiae bacterium]|nr:hypothetical protein [Candidatus Dependentiae bacterium]
HTFVVGYTRTKEIRADFNDIPHLLIAGQTMQGKSTFLRQLITTLYINNPTYLFTLIDLKEGAEFSMFKDLPRVKITADLREAIQMLEEDKNEMKEKMKTLAQNECKDIHTYFQKRKEKDKEGNPLVPSLKVSHRIIIIDEATQMFLANSSVSMAQAQKSRAASSEIARLGRAAGTHIVISVQRPDSKALDTQVKANLNGVVCFRMQDDHSSIGALGTGRATDLPMIKGRALWKDVDGLAEIQTPLLTVDAANELLKKFRPKKSEVAAEPMVEIPISPRKRDF